MRTFTGVLVLLVLAYPHGLHAQQSAGLVAGALAPTRAWDPIMRRQAFMSQTPQTSPQRRSWIARHPVLFGALVGAGAGLLSGATIGEPCKEESFCRRPALMQIGAAGGAGLGALTGWVVGLTK